MTECVAKMNFDSFCFVASKEAPVRNFFQCQTKSDSTILAVCVYTSWHDCDVSGKSSNRRLRTHAIMPEIQQCSQKFE